MAAEGLRAAQVNGFSFPCGDLHLVPKSDLVLNDHIADDDSPPLDQHVVIKQNRSTAQLRLAAHHRPML